MSEENKTPDEQLPEETSSGRRDALKKILAGTGVVTGSLLLPEKWTKPVVDSIIVPAHAVASGTQPPPTGSPTTTKKVTTPPPTSPPTSPPTTTFEPS